MVYICFHRLSTCKRIVIMQCNNEMTMQVSSVTVIFFFDILSLVHANVHIRHLCTEWLWVDFFKRALKHKNKIMERWDIVDLNWQLTSHRWI